MTLTLPRRRLALLGAASLALAAWPAMRELGRPPAGWTEALRAQAAGRVSDMESRTYQRIRRTGPLRGAEYGFQNFNRDELSVAFEVKAAALDSYAQGYGYSKAELDALKAWHEKARQAAYQDAVKRRLGQAETEASYAALKAQYDRKVEQYLRSRGFMILPGRVLQADIPAIVLRNASPLKAVALAFERIATSRRYDSESLIGAVASMVQTALLYRLPPTEEGGRRTGGILPPVRSMASGWGDCDTKTALMGSILANWPHMRMVGVDVPEHYLMGVLRIPAKGDLFVEHGGLHYVLVEPAGPAWLPPGRVGDETLALLKAADSYRIQPFFTQ